MSTSQLGQTQVETRGAALPPPGHPTPPGPTWLPPRKKALSQYARPLWMPSSNFIIKSTTRTVFRLSGAVFSADLDRRSGARLLKTIPETTSIKSHHRSNIHPRRAGNSFSSRASFVYNPPFCERHRRGYETCGLSYICKICYNIHGAFGTLQNPWR